MRKLLILTSFVFLSGTESCVKQRFYPRNHLAPPYGWMNDPNGLCFFKKDYHLFYQFNPNSSLVPGIAHWGHAKSKDMFHWEHLPIALFPDQTYDHKGVFSGSALIEDNAMYLYYTGNTEVQEQALAISVDGTNLFKYARNPVLKGESHQPHFRDPKVWKHKGMYYMVLGNLIKNGTESFGRVLLYESEDKYNWKEVAVLQESDGSLGYMSECPDFFELDGKFVLLFSPQGIKPQGDLYNNLYQTGYIVGKFDYCSKKFQPITSFVELDRGHDFYATQTMEDKGRRIVIAWFDMWDQNYPEGPDGFTGHMTLPRQLSLSKNNMLIQKPVSEIANIRGKTLCKGSNKNNETVLLPDKTGEIIVTAKNCVSFEVIISANDASAEVTLRYDYESQHVSLNRGGKDGVRRAKWNPKGNAKWQIFVDASSIELFCGDGELTFSSRFFPEDNVSVRLVSTDPVQKFVVKALKRSVTDVTLC